MPRHREPWAAGRGDSARWIASSPSSQAPRNDKPYHHHPFPRLSPPHFRRLAPVDSNGLPDQLGTVKKKPAKLEEPKAAYAAKKPAKAAPAPGQGSPSRADDATFRKITDKIFTERKELLHKLAQ